MTLDKDGKIRMDCSSPYAMASLIALRDREIYQQWPDADRTRGLLRQSMIDALLRQRIDRGRRSAGFRTLPEQVRVLEYAQQLGLGSANLEETEWVQVPANVAVSP